jgi:hypothetical protein
MRVVHPGWFADGYNFIGLEAFNFCLKSIQIFNVLVEYFDIGVKVIITGITGFFQHKAHGN